MFRASRSSYISVSEDEPTDNKKKNKKDGKKDKQQVVRYSAAKLHERGIIVEIDELPLGQ